MRAKEEKAPKYSKTQTTFEGKGIYREKEACKSQQVHAGQSMGKNFCICRRKNGITETKQKKREID